MKIGSVAFFKKLIVAAFILMLLVPVVLAIVFGVLYTGQKDRADRLEAVAWALTGGGDLPLELTEDLQLSDDMLPLWQLPEGRGIDSSFDYQTRYPNLYVSRPQQLLPEDKVCYLTFDDGPSPVTEQILETLDAYDVKATFFVTGENSEKHADILQKAADAGHTLGVHTYSHEYREIYQSVDSFLDDFEKMHARLLEITGTSSGVFRFAGGSVNVHNQYIYNEIAAEMLRRGFVFYDWNVAANDAVSGGISRQQVANNVLNGAADKDRIVVLMHDRLDNASTAAALPAIIEGLQEQGYRFAALSADAPPVTFFYQEQ